MTLYWAGVANLTMIIINLFHQNDRSLFIIEIELISLAHTSTKNTVQKSVHDAAGVWTDFPLDGENYDTMICGCDELKMFIRVMPTGTHIELHATTPLSIHCWLSRRRLLSNNFPKSTNSNQGYVMSVTHSTRDWRCSPQARKFFEHSTMFPCENDDFRVKKCFKKLFKPLKSHEFSLKFHLRPLGSFGRLETTLGD